MVEKEAGSTHSGVLGGLLRTRAGEISAFTIGSPVAVQTGSGFFIQVSQGLPTVFAGQMLATGAVLLVAMCAIACAHAKVRDGTEPRKEG